MTAKTASYVPVYTLEAWHPGKLVFRMNLYEPGDPDAILANYARGYSGPIIIFRASEELGEIPALPEYYQWEKIGPETSISYPSDEGGRAFLSWQGITTEYAAQIAVAHDAEQLWRQKS